jgi:hypothetical protein
MGKITKCTENYKQNKLWLAAWKPNIVTFIMIQAFVFRGMTAKFYACFDAQEASAASRLMTFGIPSDWIA